MATELVELKATARTGVGKGAARKARREGKIPGVIYGDGKPPAPISIDGHELSIQVQKGHFTSTVVEIDVGGKKEKVIPRDVQFDPVRDIPIHVDLLRISADGIIRAAVPVRFLNETRAPGLKRGGVLNIVRHDIEVFCPYDQMPAAFEVDLTDLDIGAAIHISDITMPENVKPTIHDRDFTVATIAGAVKEPVEEEAEDAEAEAEGEDGEAKEGAEGEGDGDGKDAGDGDKGDKS